MPGRALLVFWTAVTVSVLLLGSVFATIRHLAAGGGTGDAIALVIAGSGLGISLLVACRIVVVSGRVQRSARGEPVRPNDGTC